MLPAEATLESGSWVLKVENFICEFSRILSIFVTVKIYQMDAIWYLIGDFFRIVFTVVPFFGLWFNKVLMVIGFVAFVLWLRHMKNHQIEEKFD
jgi:hypothetical protein